MSENNLPFEQYYLASGLNAEDAKLSARAQLAFLYALIMKVIFMGTALLFTVFINTELFTNIFGVHGVERVHGLATVFLVEIILCVYFPIRARSLTFWILYLIESTFIVMLYSA